ncbi:pyruvate kinase [Demequina lignilytica]|uniref:Pyruvate kinase n=1 Tax=Demequina lignilytica TaxID=3051663 RepID=A0AAW7M4N9_9MICO|nr:MULTISPECIES: pyruvate kinase [unclassified Demequina]MDN4479022.1 pyruvate kinase [Demequina sp. SYSU T00039-1]MDN4484322.1 pyruvate kinase [Demequina sp. SYSU T0a273]MDN4489059.1 pyruvate kinase [Demequina sp. SYSU T00039]MDN4491230.1 pyruvate kinase [Demequina sp. SYSU T00068]
MRNAKIVCTIGPATAPIDQMRKLVGAGMDVARINRSHGSAEEHEQVYRNIRQAAEELGRNVAVLVDLQGPKIRLEKFADGPHELAVDDVFTITTRDVAGTKDLCGTTFKGLPGDCKVGDTLLIDDGKVRLVVTEVTDTDVVTKVVVPGPVSNNKGINLPGVAVSVPALSEKDQDDLRWGLKLGADFIALSFVRSAKDYEDVARIMAEEGRTIPVIAKVEKPQAVENLAEIVDAFDGVMVARGDLGVELPLEEVPLVQKRAIELCRSQAKPVIVATQVLESMTHSPVPTRAETSDCANAILDGTDAVMLSGETSVGDFPIVTVETMARIVKNTEEKGYSRIAPYLSTPHTRGGAITHAASEIAENLDIKYIVTFTQSGDSAQRMSRLRPNTPMLAFTPNADTQKRLALSWGVHAELVDPVYNTDDMVSLVDSYLKDSGRAVDGDYVIVVSGTPVGVPGTTNSIFVHKVGQVRH